MEIFPAEKFKRSVSHLSSFDVIHLHSCPKTIDTNNGIKSPFKTVWLLFVRPYVLVCVCMCIGMSGKFMIDFAYRPP
jgi:hypothetical protein